MMRKTLIALTAAGALGVSSAAIAASHGSHHSGMGPSPGSHAIGMGPMSAGPSTRSNFISPRGSLSTRSNFISPRGSLSTRSNTWSGNTWKGANWDGGRRHHHNRFRNAAFIGVGFGAGFYGGYDSCWRLVPTYWGGWQRVWVCDPYDGGYGGYWGY
jgi:hypothetical protein